MDRTSDTSVYAIRGALRITPLEKMQEKTLMASLRRRLKNQDESALPRLPPCARAQPIGAAPLAYLSICIAQR